MAVYWSKACAVQSDVGHSLGVQYTVPVRSAIASPEFRYDSYTVAQCLQWAQEHVFCYLESCRTLCYDVSSVAQCAAGLVLTLSSYHLDTDPNCSCWDHLQRCWDHLQRCWDHLQRCWDHLQSCWDNLQRCWDHLQRCWDHLKRCWDHLQSCWVQLIKSWWDQLNNCWNPSSAAESPQQLLGPPQQPLAHLNSCWALESRTLNWDHDHINSGVGR